MEMEKEAAASWIHNSSDTVLDLLLIICFCGYQAAMADRGAARCLFVCAVVTRVTTERVVWTEGGGGQH